MVDIQPSAGSRNRRVVAPTARRSDSELAELPPVFHHGALWMASLLGVAIHPSPASVTATQAVDTFLGRLAQFWGPKVRLTADDLPVADRRNRLEEVGRFDDHRKETAAAVERLSEERTRLHFARDPHAVQSLRRLHALSAETGDFFLRIRTGDDGSVRALMTLKDELHVARNAVAKHAVRASHVDTPASPVVEALDLLIEDWKTVLKFDAAAYWRILATRAIHQQAELDTLLDSKGLLSGSDVPNELTERLTTLRDLHNDAIRRALNLRQELVLLAAEQSPYAAEHARSFYHSTLAPSFAVLTSELDMIPPHRPPQQRIDRDQTATTRTVDELLSAIEVDAADTSSWLQSWAEEIPVQTKRPEPIDFRRVDRPSEVDERPTVVVVYPHADDEAMLVAKIRKLSESGYRVVLYVATDGAGGTPQNPYIDRPSLHQLIPMQRIWEQLTSGALLNVDRVIIGPDGDSGMDGNPTRGELQLAQGGNVAVHLPMSKDLQNVINEERAVAVVTGQSENDCYTHPDHKTVPLTVRHAVGQMRKVPGFERLALVRLSMSQGSLWPLLRKMDETHVALEEPGFAIHPSLNVPLSHEIPTHIAACSPEHVAEGVLALHAHVSQVAPEMVASVVADSGHLGGEVHVTTEPGDDISRSWLDTAMTADGPEPLFKPAARPTLEAGRTPILERLLTSPAFAH